MKHVKDIVLFLIAGSALALSVYNYYQIRIDKDFAANDLVKISKLLDDVERNNNEVINTAHELTIYTDQFKTEMEDIIKSPR